MSTGVWSSSTGTEMPREGPGREQPIEAGSDPGLSPDTTWDEKEFLEPTPLVNPNYKVMYPYNKVTKYNSGHKLEFNTYPGNEYINLEHGIPKVRMTMMGGGTMEIRQQGDAASGSSGTGASPTQGGRPNIIYYHEVIDGDHLTEVKDGNKAEVVLDGQHLQRTKEQYVISDDVMKIRCEEGNVEIQAGQPDKDFLGRNRPGGRQFIIMTAAKVIIASSLEVCGDITLSGEIIKSSGCSVDGVIKGKRRGTQADMEWLEDWKRQQEDSGKWTNDFTQDATDFGNDGLAI